uniref:Uncharacterized protein n=1 Tax=Arundo donax TaxID=35708 RepID=A0A0A9GFS2_ARUDO
MLTLAGIADFVQSRRKIQIFLLSLHLQLIQHAYSLRRHQVN